MSRRDANGRWNDDSPTLPVVSLVVLVLVTFGVLFGLGGILMPDASTGANDESVGESNSDANSSIPSDVEEFVAITLSGDEGTTVSSATVDGGIRADGPIEGSVTIEDGTSVEGPLDMETVREDVSVEDDSVVQDGIRSGAIDGAKLAIEDEARIEGPIAVEGVTDGDVEIENDAEIGGDVVVLDVGDDDRIDVDEEAVAGEIVLGGERL